MFHETEHNVFIFENGKIAYAVYLNEAGDLENVWFGKALSDIKATTRTSPFCSIHGRAAPFILIRRPFSHTLTLPARSGRVTSPIPRSVWRSSSIHRSVIRSPASLRTSTTAAWLLILRRHRLRCSGRMAMR